MNYIAHIDTENRIQSVYEHCTETAKKAERYANVFNMGNTALLQGRLHDLGKLCGDFTQYIKNENNMKRGDIDHSYAGARFLNELAGKRNDAVSLETAQFIARTIISHHGLHDWIDEDGNDYFDRRISRSERYDEICSAAEEIANEEKLSEMLDKASMEYVAVKKEIMCISKLSKNIHMSFGFYMGLFERLMQSVLVDADRTDTADFMSAESTEYVCNIQELWEEMSRKIEKKYEDFRLKEDAVSKRRTDISDRCFKFAEKQTRVCRLIVPTGGGKTLSSLRFAVEYAKRNKLERIFYIAPFMSILEQNSDVIKEFAGEDNFLEHYSDILQQLDNDAELEEYELRTQKWDKPVIATTLVQFLNSLYSGKMSAVRRMNKLSGAVIIIDEIQAVPMKCVNLFNLAVNFLSHICNSTIVLCSATQPSFENTEYPIIFDENDSMTGNFNDDFDALRRVRLIPALRKEGYTYEEAAEFCMDKVRENSNLLLVVNTKRAAAEMFRILDELTGDDTKVIHLSTNMCPEHRRESINDIKKALLNKEKIVCVTTQLIEAGVDISFKCVVRSLAGLDNAAQAAGRCNRNGEYDVCSTYIIDLTEEELGNLQEIKDRQGVSRMVIGTDRYDDLLEVDAMNEYFNKLYSEHEKEMSYPAEDIRLETNLINLLSLNLHRRGKQGLIGRQAFKTAGEKFNVFDSITEDVIVPYNSEAEELINDLNGELYPYEAEKKLRKAQKYTVQIFPNVKKILEKDALYNLKCGALALRQEYYDSRGVGILENGVVPDVIMY